MFLTVVNVKADVRFPTFLLFCNQWTLPPKHHPASLLVLEGERKERKHPLRDSAKKHPFSKTRKLLYFLGSNPLLPNLINSCVSCILLTHNILDAGYDILNVFIRHISVDRQTQNFILHRISNRKIRRLMPQVAISI